MDKYRVLSIKQFENGYFHVKIIKAKTVNSGTKEDCIKYINYMHFKRVDAGFTIKKYQEYVEFFKSDAPLEKLIYKIIEI